MTSIAEVITEATKTWAKDESGRDLISHAVLAQREADMALIKEQTGVLAVFITSGRASSASPDEVANAITQHLARKIGSQP